MKVRIIVAPPASGKTHFCIERVIETQRTDPLAAVWFVVPDGYQAVAIRRRLAAAGGVLGVHVNTFESVFRELLELAGRLVPLAPPPLARQLIRDSIAIIYRRGGLDYYKSSHILPGFVSVVQKRIRDLKRSHICPEDFLADAQNSPPRLHELGLIYQTYKSLLGEIAWADREGINWLAVEQLETRPQFAPAWKLLVLDCFGSFTQLQYRALELLAERLPEIIISLPGTTTMTRAKIEKYIGTGIPAPRNTNCTPSGTPGWRIAGLSLR
ncbi:MAG: hypothetical protein WBD56_02560 [Anaerolineales bacterium]